MLLVGSWAVSFVLMAATSTGSRRLVRRGQGHEIAQGYGSFLWAGVVLYAMVAWRVWVRRSETPPARSTDRSRLVGSQVSSQHGVACHGRSSRPDFRKLDCFLIVRLPIVTIIAEHIDSGDQEGCLSEDSSCRVDLRSADPSRPTRLQAKEGL